MGSILNQPPFKIIRPPNFMVVHRKSAANFAVAHKNRRRPARPQLMLAGEIQIICPERIVEDICYDHRFAAVSCRPARPYFGADRHFFQWPILSHKGMGGRTRVEILSGFIEEKKRGKQSFRKWLDAR